MPSLISLPEDTINEIVAWVARVDLTDTVFEDDNSTLVGLCLVHSALLRSSQRRLWKKARFKTGLQYDSILSLADTLEMHDMNKDPTKIS